MAKLKENKRKNGTLCLRPIKFEEAVKAILDVKPKGKETSSKVTESGNPPNSANLK